jgi:hypothetical protein
MSTVIFGASMKNGDALVRRLAEAFEDWAREDIDDAYWDDQFKDMGLWRYERETRRKNGAVVESPRDIYDTGALYQSGRDSFRISSSPNQVAANWAWDAVGSNGYHYARDVHEGEGTSAGFPRKWTDELAVPQKFDASIVKQALLLKINAAMDRR